MPKVNIVSDIDDALKLWETFTPNKNLFDTWDFRLAFWMGYHYDPYFVVLKDGSKPVALLPLWYETEDKGYHWFGSWWQEDNIFFVENPELVSPLLDAAPQPLRLSGIQPKALRKNKQLAKSFAADDPKFILNLKKFTSSNEFLASLTHKKRYNFRRDQRKIVEQRPQIIFNRFEDFDALVDLSRKRSYAKGEEFDCDDERCTETFRQVIELGQKNKTYAVRMITTEIDGTIAGVDLITLYKGTYYCLKCGYDVENFPGIGSFMNLLEIDDAVSTGAHTIDFLGVNYGWKDKWFTPLPRLKYEK